MDNHRNGSSPQNAGNSEIEGDAEKAYPESSTAELSQLESSDAESFEAESQYQHAISSPAEWYEAGSSKSELPELESQESDSPESDSPKSAVNSSQLRSSDYTSSAESGSADGALDGSGSIEAESTVGESDSIESGSMESGSMEIAAVNDSSGALHSEGVLNQGDSVRPQTVDLASSDAEPADAAMDLSDPSLLLQAVEALLFVSGEPLSVIRLVEVLERPEAEIVSALAELESNFANRQAGVTVVRVQGGYQLRSVEGVSSLIQKLKSTKPRRLSGPALETLAIIAYRQPIVKSDVEKLRGVDATPTLKTLIDRNLIKVVGQQPTAGTPGLYGTTDEFLKLFGLDSLKELPALRELRELESDPGETVAEDSSEEGSNDGESDSLQHSTSFSSEPDLDLPSVGLSASVEVVDEGGFADEQGTAANSGADQSEVGHIDISELSSDVQEDPDGIDSENGVETQADFH